MPNEASDEAYAATTPAIGEAQGLVYDLCVSGDSSFSDDGDGKHTVYCMVYN